MNEEQAQELWRDLDTASETISEARHLTPSIRLVAMHHIIKNHVNIAIEAKRDGDEDLRLTAERRARRMFAAVRNLLNDPNSNEEAKLRASLIVMTFAADICPVSDEEKKENLERYIAAGKPAHKPAQADPKIIHTTSKIIQA